MKLIKSSKRRDRALVAFCNFLITNFASKEYNKRANQVLTLGMDELDRRAETWQSEK
jgi:hypothetical protein